MPTSPQFSILARSWRPASLTQAHASRLLGIDASTLNKIEQGERGAAAWVLDRMRQVYALTPSEVEAGVIALAEDRAARVAAATADDLEQGESL